MFDYLLAYLPIAIKYILLTCIVELTVALLFRIFSLKIVLAANIASQIFLHIVVLITFYTPLNKYTQIIYLGIELVVLTFEYSLYSILIKDKKKTLLGLYPT